MSILEMVKKIENPDDIELRSNSLDIFGSLISPAVITNPAHIKKTQLLLGKIRTG